MSLTKKITSLSLFILLAFGASAWGSYVTNLYKEPWYSMLTKSSFNPPEWVFAPVWITLYIAMSVAIWLIWINPKRVEKIIYIYFIHLLINGSWSIFFFGLHLILASLIVVAIIIFFVVWLIISVSYTHMTLPTILLV